MGIEPSLYLPILDLYRSFKYQPGWLQQLPGMEAQIQCFRLLCQAAISLGRVGGWRSVHGTRVLGLGAPHRTCCGTEVGPSFAVVLGLFLRCCLTAQKTYIYPNPHLKQTFNKANLTLMHINPVWYFYD